eukprot:GDKI01024818.1.p1 GENE.GDKI01024818.1~~GDKI01024818.1.p1  ORF type:complete len:1201 (+),score=397.54 GDKI01024818.1:91-3603(+)
MADPSAVQLTVSESNLNDAEKGRVNIATQPSDIEVHTRKTGGLDADVIRRRSSGFRHHRPRGVSADGSDHVAHRVSDLIDSLPGFTVDRFDSKLSVAFHTVKQQIEMDIQKKQSSMDVVRRESKAQQVALQTGAAVVAVKEEGELAVPVYTQGDQKVAEAAKKAEQVDEHLISLDELCGRYNVALDRTNPLDSEGLNDTQVQMALAQYGPNSLKPPKTIPEWIKFLMYFTTPLMILLEVAAALAFITYGIVPDEPSNLIVGCILLGCIVFSNTLDYLQDRKATALMASFKNLMAASSQVRRNGKQLPIPSDQLVPGDIVVVKLGDKVPADLRIVQCSNLKVDNSSLTGEVEPQKRGLITKEQNPLEAENLAWSGTMVVEGTGVGVVIRTGDQTLIGNLAKLASAETGLKSTLAHELHIFVLRIAAMSLALGIFCVVLSVITLPSQPWNVTMLIGISITCANIPQGLPSTVTICLTIVAQRLARQSVFVKRLETVETLGSVTTIASDKTGTLTQNRMTVTYLWSDLKITSDNPNMNKPAPDFTAASNKALVDVAALCNRAFFLEDKENAARALKDKLIEGDATESALLRFCQGMFDVVEYKTKNPKFFEIPFNSRNKWQLSLHYMDLQETETVLSRREKKSGCTLFLKGAPERVVDMCQTYMKNGVPTPIDEDFKKAYDIAYKELAGYGCRVLGFSSLSLSGDELHALGQLNDKTFEQRFAEESGRNLTFCGLMALMDPPKPEVPGEVQQCRAAGIRVTMVTGDHPLTAKAIARAVNIITVEESGVCVIERDFTTDNKEYHDAIEKCQAIVIHGEALAKFDEWEWEQTLKRREIVFARTSPQQKLEIVRRFQSKHEIVAVTGDGVNDAPALKQANVGCAMGSGTEVSKEAAAIILLDDSFSAISTGVREGRTVFDNLRKSVAYTLTHLTPEAVPVLATSILQMPIGISSILILFIDLVTEMGPAVSIAYEANESDIMNRPPRNAKTDRLVSRNVFLWGYLHIGIVEAVACFCSYFWCFWRRLGMNGTDLIGALKDGYFIEGAEDWTDRRDGTKHNYAAQMDALYEVQSLWFLNIVLCQAGNMIASRTRFLSMFEHGIFKNFPQFPSWIFSLGFVCLILYTPAIQDGLLTRGPTDEWMFGFIGAVYIVVYSEIIKLIRRKYPGGFVDKYIAW